MVNFKINKHDLVYLEISINGVKLLRVLRELRPDVLRANEDGFKVRPRPLHLKPDGDHRVRSCQLLLPV